MEKWLRKYHRLRTIPSKLTWQLLFRKASKRWRTCTAKLTAARQIASIEADLASVLCIDRDLHSFLDSRFATLQGFPISTSQRQQVTGLLNEKFSQWVDRCLNSANAIIENRVSILGHELRLGDTVNWHKDYVSGVVWPCEHPAGLRKISLNHGSDIKFVWELSRFHHGVALARAFALTADERYARKFLALFAHWRERNPPCTGPNWVCTMEVAIRAVNLLWAGALLASSKAFDHAARESFVKSLLSHGAFIYHNLEYTERVVGHSLQPVNGNHYLADLAGLLYVSCAFPECRYATQWRDRAQKELFREIRSQVDEEGVHCEYSPGYHRLVLEMVLGCLILLERQAVAVPDDIRRKALKMVDFIRHYRRPSGGVPLVRDNDSGRFCILGDEELTSHDHLLALGAIYFDHPDLYPGQLFEDCLWYLGPRAHEWHTRQPASCPSPPREERGPSLLQDSKACLSASSKLYRQSGFCVMRHGSHYLLAVCSSKGMQGYCGHTHNDFLSFELEAFGRTFLTDCGSYVYSQSPEWRNRMRSTASHNTVVLDGLEQNRFSPSELFQIDSQVQPAVLGWISSREWDVLEAAYTLPLPDGTEATHERRFVFFKDRDLWLIGDRVLGTGPHTIETRFHFAEGIQIAPAGDRVYCARCSRGPKLFLVALGTSPLTAHVDSGWVSSSYASKRPIHVLRLIKSLSLPFEQWYVLAPTQSEGSHDDFPLSEWESLRRTACQTALPRAVEPDPQAS